MDKQDLKAAITRFLEEALQIPLKENFRIFDDTGIDGADAFDLMLEFSKRFQVDMSDFDPDLYFTSEKDLMNIPKRIFNRVKKGKMHLFTVNHLVEVAVKGKWFDPVRK